MTCNILYKMFNNTGNFLFAGKNEIEYNALQKSDISFWSQNYFSMNFSFSYSYRQQKLK